MEKSHRASLILCLSLLLACLTLSVRPSMAEKKKITIGLMLDLSSDLGYMANNSIDLAIRDFYSQHPNYKTQIDLKIKDSPNTTAAYHAARDLIGKEKVHAILGPQNAEEAFYAVNHGNKTGIPVIWFPITGPTLLPPPSNYLIESSQPPCFQFNAIAAIVEALGWQSIIAIYEQTEYGSYLRRCLISGALKELNTRVRYESIDPDSPDLEAEINTTIDVLKSMPTRVFLVHMNVDPGETFIKLAQKRDMMGEGYAWILTQGLSSQIDPGVNYITLKGYMQGALGVRPKAPRRTSVIRALEDAFKGNYSGTPTLYGWWAYDTIQALAVALESEKEGMGKHDYGPKLHNAILQATDHNDFRGVSGDFSLKKEQLEPSRVEVYNVIGQRERIIGYWSQRSGLVQNDSEIGDAVGKYKLKEPMWPGDTMEKPPKLKIGVPRKHFTELVSIERPCGCTRPQTFGLAVNVFLKVLDLLPFPLYYEFVPLTSVVTDVTEETYDDLLCQIDRMNLDAIIGDITIVANRTRCVDFTLPYLDSSVSMAVKVKQPSISKGILLEPFHWSLWLLLGGIFTGATIIAITLENNARTKKSTGDDGHDKKKFDKNELIFNPFLIHKIDKMGLESMTARWMVILTSFLFVIISQVYLANLTSILSERKTPRPSYEDVGVIRDKNLTVGYQRDSWVRGLLIEQLKLRESQLRDYGTREEYNDTLYSGSVVAIFDETPYLRLFLSKYNSDFMMAGPIYKTGGFAFAFPKNSSLVSYFSNAILNVTQDVETFRVLRTKSSLPTTIYELEYSEYESDLETQRLGITDIGGLYPIGLYVLALVFGLVILNFSQKIQGLPCWPKTSQPSNSSERN